MTALIRPTVDLFETWRDCVREYDGVGLDGSGAWQVTDFGPDRASFDALLAVLAEEADVSRPLRGDRVHSDGFWITDPADSVIGFIAVRHTLGNEFLRTQGGHIGYSIRPSRRREGHASRALGLALVHARGLGLDRVLVTCDEGNIASARTIESRSGVFESVIEGKRRYWIDC